MALPRERQTLASKVLALDAIAIIVHRDLPLDGLALSDLAELFAGYIVDWEELGAGHGQPELLSREDGSVVRRFFEETVMGQRAVSTAARVIPHDQGIVEYVSQHPRAIGYASRARMDGPVKPLALDGTMPLPADIQIDRAPECEGCYPLSYPLLVLISPAAPDDASRLVSFALSDEGRRIIEERYVLPR